MLDLSHLVEDWEAHPIIDGTCQSCGADLITDSEYATMLCNYCDGSSTRFSAV